eukprot:2020248-Amphidinium_carterae.1
MGAMQVKEPVLQYLAHTPMGWELHFAKMCNVRLPHAQQLSTKVAYLIRPCVQDDVQNTDESDTVEILQIRRNDLGLSFFASICIGRFSSVTSVACAFQNSRLAKENDS